MTAPRWFPRGADVFAGVTVALVLVPQSLAYAELAGMPVHHGLYVSTLPLVFAGFFASSPFLQTGPVALTSLLVFGALAPIARPGSADWVAAAAVLAVLVGAIRLLLGILRTGAVVRILTPPLVRGFTVAAGILILASQVPSVLGVESAGGLVQGALVALAEPAGWNPLALALAAATLALMFGGKRLHPMFPGVLLAGLLGIAVGAAGLDAGPVIGTIPNAFPTPTVALQWELIPTLALPALVVAVVGFAEPASIARGYADEDGTEWSADAEFVSQGVASVTAGFVSGFPVGGSFSRSALSRVAGAETRAAGVITGLTVLAFLPLAQVLEPLPRAVLGAIVLGAAMSLLRAGPIRSTFAAGRSSAVVATVTCAATLAAAPRIEFGVLAGVLAAGMAAWLGRRG